MTQQDIEGHIAPLKDHTTPEGIYVKASCHNDGIRDIANYFVEEIRHILTEVKKEWDGHSNTLHTTIGAFESANARLEKENKALREHRNYLEGIIGKAIEMVNTPGTTFARLPEAINAKIMDRDRLIQNRINQIDALEKELSTLRGTYPVNEAATPAEMAAVEQASHALEDALRREAVANKIIELLVVAGHVPGERVGQARQLVEKL